MNKNNISSVLLLFCALFSWSQTFNITGKVVDENGITLPYTNILLLNATDSTLVTGTTTDDNGKYLFSNIEPDEYLLKFSYIGFTDAFEPLSVSADVEVRTIVLQESTETLGEVEIVYEKPTLTRQPDRIVFNVANTALTEGNVKDVLRSTPGVLILDNRIQFKNSSPVIYINDRRVHLTSDEVLELLEGTSASSIKSVEVITNPSAKYDADSGIVLNIVMDKNVITGYHGSLFTNYTQAIFPRQNIGMTNFFKVKKLSVFLNYSYNHNKIDRRNEERVDYLQPNGNLDQRWSSNLNRNTWNETHTISTNIDYEFDDRNALSLSSSMLFLPYFKYIINNHTNIVDPLNDPLFSFSSNNLSRDNKSNIGLDLNYKHNFKKDDASLTVNSHYTTYDYRRDQEVNSNYFDSNGDFVMDTAFNTRADQETQILTNQIDYELPINDTSSFSAGIKGTNIETQSAIIQNDIFNGQEILDPDSSSAFDYDENVYAAYANYSKDWEKWQISLGIRAEQTNIEGRSITINQINEQDYFELFPSVSVLHNASEKLDVYANYKRSITRPNYNYLNPFQFYLNDNTIVAGNPNLQPVFIDHFITGVSLNDNYIFEFYYKYSKDNIFEIPFQDNTNNTLTYTYSNLESTIELGFDFLAFFTIVDNWDMTAITSFYYTKDEGNFNGSVVQQDQWANYSLLSNNISLLKDKSLNINLSFIYSSANLQGLQLVEKGQLFSDFSASKTILNGNGTLSVAVSDIFDLQDYHVSTRFLNQDSFNLTDLDTRYVRVGFRYKFGNTKLSTNQKTLSKEERDRLRESDN